MPPNFTFKPKKEVIRTLRKLSKATGFSMVHIINEILIISFRNGLAKDLFWIYRKDYSDPFWNRKTTKGMDTTLILKDAFSSIESVFSEQETRINDLERNHTKIVNDIVNGKVTQKQLTEYILEMDMDT